MDRMTCAALVATMAVMTVGCAAPMQKGVTKRVSFEIAVYGIDGRLQWRTTLIHESGTHECPEMTEKIR